MRVNPRQVPTGRTNKRRQATPIIVLKYTMPSSKSFAPSSSSSSLFSGEEYDDDHFKNNNVSNVAEFIFDELLILSSSTHRTIDQGLLTYDRKSIYGGSRANWKLNLRDISDVLIEQSTTVDHHNNNNDRQLILEIVGEKYTFKCIATLSDNLESFVTGLKSAHRNARAKIGKGVKKEEGPRRVTLHASGGRASNISGGRNLLHHHHQNATTQDRGRVGVTGGGSGGRKPLGHQQQKVVITPATHNLTPIMSPFDKKRKPNSRRYLSPQRSIKRMSQYDPAMEEDEHDVDKEVLVLPPKSSRGATPVKLRTSLTTSLSSPAAAAMFHNQLSGISGGLIRLRKKGPLLDDDERISIRAEVDKKLTKSDTVDDNEEYDAEHYGSPSCKRKLLIDDNEGVNDNEVGDEDGGVEGYTPKKTASSLPQSSSLDKLLITESEEFIVGETTNKKATNIGVNCDQASSSSVPEQKAPLKSISNFFAPKGNIKSGKTSVHEETKVSLPSLSTTTTYKSPSTPLKKIRILEDSNVLSTPPQRIQPTPVPILSQRKTVGSWYDNSRNDIATNHSSEEDEDVLPGYDSMDAYGGHYADENEAGGASPHSHVEKLDNTHRVAPRPMYGMRNRLGQSRLAIKSNQQNNPYDRNRKSTSPYINGTSVTSPTTYSVQRGLNFDTSFSTSDSALAPSRNNGRNNYGWLDKRKEVYSPKNTSTPSLSSTSAVSIPGIRNLGNTCYLSASLQALFSIPQFITDLYKTYAALSEGNKTMPLTEALLGLAKDIGVLIDNLQLLSSGSGSTMAAANPAALKKQMDVLTEKFAGYEQRDSHEFLSDLVDYLHDELEACPVRQEGVTVASATTASTTMVSSEQEEGRALSPNENNHPNETKNEVVGDEGKDTVEGKGTSSALLPTDKYFQLNVRVCLKCDSCGYSRSKDEMYRHLSVDVGEDSEIETWTVERSLQQFFQPEKRDLKCERCNAGKTATQTLEIISCPKALILHFKRFIVTQEEQHARKSSVETSDDKDNPVIIPRMEMVLRKNEVNMYLSCFFIVSLILLKLRIDFFPGQNSARGVSFNPPIRKQNSRGQSTCSIYSSRCCTSCWKDSIFRPLYHMCKEIYAQSFRQRSMGIF